VCSICERNASTVADHKIPHKGSWFLFRDISNLWGICVDCHAKKTAAEDGGFGNYVVKSRPETNTARPIGDGGKTFQSSTISQDRLNAALDFDAEELLKDLPK